MAAETGPRPIFSRDPGGTHQVYLEDIARNVGYFVESPYKSYGDSDSWHGVMFGALAPYGDVAIKPHERLTAAVHEKEVLEYVRGKGFEALEPLTIASEGLYDYLVTVYRPGLRHLGQVAWNENVASKRLKTVLTPTLNMVGRSSRIMHQAGITHGDMQAKNFMLTSEGDHVIGDVEKGQIRLSGLELARKADGDLVRFGISVLRRGLLSDRSQRYRLAYLGDELIDPNLDSMPPLADYDRRQAILDGVVVKLIGKHKAKHPAGRALAKRAA